MGTPEHVKVEVDWLLAIHLLDQEGKHVNAYSNFFRQIRFSLYWVENGKLNYNMSTERAISVLIFWLHMRSSLMWENTFCNTHLMVYEDFYMKMSMVLAKIVL